MAEGKPCFLFNFFLPHPEYLPQLSLIFYFLLIFFSHVPFPLVPSSSLYLKA